MRFMNFVELCNEWANLIGLSANFISFFELYFFDFSNYLIIASQDMIRKSELLMMQLRGVLISWQSVEVSYLEKLCFILIFSLCKYSVMSLTTNT